MGENQRKIRRKVLEMKTVNINRREEIQPIEFKKYEGEDVCVSTVIRKGQRIQNWEFYPDKVNCVPRGNAYVIGNGPSRKDFDLNRLKDTGQTYGCNALYRDFMPDFIFSVDAKMTAQMIMDDVCKKTVHYAPALEVNRKQAKGMIHLIPHNPHWISGNAAILDRGCAWTQEHLLDRI